MGLFIEAVEAYVQKLELNPMEFGTISPAAQTLANKEICLHRLKHHKEAIQAFKQAVDFFSDNETKKN